MEPSDILTWLREHAHVEDCWYVHSVYEGSFKTPDGDAVDGKLTITQHQLRNEPGPRFKATVVTRDGKRATGNAETSIQSALAGVHWHDLN